MSDKFTIDEIKEALHRAIDEYSDTNLMVLEQGCVTTSLMSSNNW